MIIPRIGDEVHIILSSGTMFNGIVKCWGYADNIGLVWSVISPQVGANIKSTDTIIQNKHIAAYEIVENIKENPYDNKQQSSLWTTPADPKMVVPDLDHNVTKENIKEAVEQIFIRREKNVNNSKKWAKPVHQYNEEQHDEELENYIENIPQEEIRPKMIPPEDAINIKHHTLDPNLRNKKLAELKILQTKAKQEEVKQHLKRSDLGGVKEIAYEYPFTQRPRK